MFVEKNSVLLDKWRFENFKNSYSILRQSYHPFTNWSRVWVILLYSFQSFNRFSAKKIWWHTFNRLNAFWLTINVLKFYIPLQPSYSTISFTVRGPLSLSLCLYLTYIFFVSNAVFLRIEHRHPPPLPT